LSSVVVTPAVKREVQAHFNCETLEGAELEDQVLIKIDFSYLI